MTPDGDQRAPSRYPRCRGLGQEKLVRVGWENRGPQTHPRYEGIRKDPGAARASPHRRMAPLSLRL